MYCPNCSQEQISKETKFCSRCGFLMTGVIKLVENGGGSEESALQETSANTPRKRGLKQGLFVFLLTFLVVPIITILTIAADAEPFLVVISLILFGVGGLLRMVYALLFESNEGAAESKFSGKFVESAQNLIGKKQNEKILPPSQTIPAETYMSPKQGNWRETNELVETTVTDETTKLLNKNKQAVKNKDEIDESEIYR